MRTIINAEQLRVLLNDSRKMMSEQPRMKAWDEQSEAVAVPHGKMEALHRLECDDWVFVPVARTRDASGGRLIEHGFEVHRRDSGWEVITAALEIEQDSSARIHSEPARDHAVQQELEKMRVQLLAENSLEEAHA